MANTVDQDEIAKFTAMAEEWWDPNGTFKPLHRFNPVRIRYIRETVIERFSPQDVMRPLKGLKLLDIGCGGGLVSEPMARLGADVTGIDAAEKNIAIASLHATQSGLAIDYQHQTVEVLAQTQAAQFDVVLNMEVVEHVADVEAFLTQSAALVKPGGLMVIATLNRTAKAFALAIVGAEYILGWLPRGTHDWQKFLKPSELIIPLQAAGLALAEQTGVSYNPLTQEWRQSRDMSVNYMLVMQKPPMG